MDDAWLIGPFLIKERWVIYLVAGLIAYLIIRVGVAKTYIATAAPERLWNSLFIFAIGWKLSYTLFHPVHVWIRPTSQIYFTGGDKGLVLGLCLALLYLLYRSYKEKVSFDTYLEPGLIAILSSFGIFQLIAIVVDTDPFVYGLLPFLLCGFLVVYWFVKRASSSDTLLWPGMLLWFGLGELFFSYFKEQAAIWLGFSLFQWVLIMLCLIAAMVTYRKSRSFKQT